MSAKLAMITSRQVTTIIKRLVELLIDDKINLIDVPWQVRSLKGQLNAQESKDIVKLFDKLSAENIEGLKLIDWERVTGVPFEDYPPEMTVKEILLQPYYELAESAEHAIAGCSF